MSRCTKNPVEKTSLSLLSKVNVIEFRIRIFVTGLGVNGLDVTGHTYMYDKNLDLWDDTLPQFPLGIFLSNNCGVVNQNGDISVVVVGGYIYGDYFSSVYIFSVEERTWRTGID